MEDGRTARCVVAKARQNQNQNQMRQNKPRKYKQSPDIENSKHVPENSGSQTRQGSLNRKSSHACQAVCKLDQGSGKSSKELVLQKIQDPLYIKCHQL